MKLGIIASSLADLHITHITQHYDHEYCVFLDNQFGSWGCLSREDSLDRLNNILSSKQAQSCDAFLLPPVYELHLLQTQALSYTAKIIPLYTSYLQVCVLPNSLVGKMGLLCPLRHQVSFQTYRDNMVKSHVLAPKQQTNKHFQKQFPLYAAGIDHWDILYAMTRSRFVNKLIKLDLKKLKDYAIDTLVPTSYAYFKYEKVFAQVFHNKVRIHKRSSVERLAKQFLSVNLSDYTIHIYTTGDSVLLDGDQGLLRRLSKGNHCQIQKHKLHMI